MALDVAKLVKNAFITLNKTADGATSTAVYSHVSGTGTYNPVTGQVSGGATLYPLPQVTLTNFKSREVTGIQIPARNESRMVNLLIPYVDLPIQPTIKDTITVTDSKTGVVTRWNLVAFVIDPTKSLHRLTVQQA